MKAQVIHSHGDVDQMTFEENWPDPTPEDGHVVIRVGACTLNYHDLFTLRGMPGIKVPMPIIMGIDMAGTVAAVGPNCGEWKEGDRVLVDPLNRERYTLLGETVDGGLAEYCKVPANQLIKLPDGVSFEAAAALPVAYGTAYRKDVLGRDEVLGAIDPAKINVKGSSLAYGHPFAATGARILGLTAKLLAEGPGKRALISVCTAGGMGVAALVESAS